MLVAVVGIGAVEEEAIVIEDRAITKTMKNMIAKV
jgi:hypothetical protein